MISKKKTGNYSEKYIITKDDERKLKQRGDKGKYFRPTDNNPNIPYSSNKEMYEAAIGIIASVDRDNSKLKDKKIVAEYNKLRKNLLENQNLHLC